MALCFKQLSMADYYDDQCGFFNTPFFIYIIHHAAQQFRTFILSQNLLYSFFLSHSRVYVNPEVFYEMEVRETKSYFMFNFLYLDACLSSLYILVIFSFSFISYVLFVSCITSRIT